MIPLLNLRHLAAALEVQRTGSISAATEGIHLSQSAITQALSKLEHVLGHTLFTRTSKGLYATEVGEIFLQRAARAIHRLKPLDTMLATKGNGKIRQLHRLFTSSQLRALMTVVEHGSYTLAADRLKLSQPTVHRAVRDMETVCGQSFFRRSPVGVEPSWQARQAARYASLFFAELAQGIDEIGEYAGYMTSSLRVGCLPLARTRIVPHAVTALLGEFPAARVSIVDGPYAEQLHGLLHGHLDIIVGALRKPAPSTDIEQEPLFRSPLHVALRPEHPLASKQSLTARQLQELAWIAPRQNTPAREAFSRFFESRNLQPPKHVIECSSLVATRGLLLESDRAALLSSIQVEIEVRHGLLTLSPQQLAGTQRSIGLATRRAWKPTRVQARFLELIRHNYSDRD